MNSKLVQIINNRIRSLIQLLMKKRQSYTYHSCHPQSHIYLHMSYSLHLHNRSDRYTQTRQAGLSSFLDRNTDSMHNDQLPHNCLQHSLLHRHTTYTENQQCHCDNAMYKLINENEKQKVKLQVNVTVVTIIILEWVTYKNDDTW